MPKPLKTVRVAPQTQPKYDYTMKVVRAEKTSEGVKFKEINELHCEHPRDAYSMADRIQREFDEDGDPCRTYVYKGNDPVPVHAGLERSTFRGIQYAR